jgi:hypothetical protein
MACSIHVEHVMGCDVAMLCHTCAFLITNMRGKDTLYSNGSRLVIIMRSVYMPCHRH